MTAPNYMQTFLGDAVLNQKLNAQRYNPSNSAKYTLDRRDHVEQQNADFYSVFLALLVKQNS